MTPCSIGVTRPWTGMKPSLEARSDRLDARIDRLEVAVNRLEAKMDRFERTVRRWLMLQMVCGTACIAVLLYWAWRTR